MSSMNITPNNNFKIYMRANNITSNHGDNFTIDASGSSSIIFNTNDFRRASFNNLGLVLEPSGNTITTAQNNNLILDASNSIISFRRNGTERVRITDASSVFLNNIDLSSNNLVNVNNINFLTNQLKIGFQAGSINQGANAIAIGYQAGFTQQGTNSISIGYQAGLSQQGTGGIAIGYQAGSITQSTNAISIGTQAGASYQGTNSIAIGYQAGNTQQGQYAIAIGSNAGSTNQHANSIVINASGSTINSGTTNTCHIYPIRNTTQSNLLYYSSTTGELGWSSTGSLTVGTLNATSGYQKNGTTIVSMNYGAVSQSFTTTPTSYNITMPSGCDCYNLISWTPVAAANNYLTIYDWSVGPWSGVLGANQIRITAALGNGVHLEAFSIAFYWRI